MADVQEVDIDLIQTDVEQIQTRLGLDEERVTILSEKYKEEGAAAFPPPIVYLDADGVLWLADGHYRLAAIRKALGPEDPRVVLAEVREGSKRDAIYCAAGANGKHGTQLTWQETRRNIERLLRDPEWGQMSDREIASHTGVSNYYVSKIHRELDAQDGSVSGSQIPPKPKRKPTVKRGKQKFPMDVGNIGHGKKKEASDEIPSPPAAPEVSQEEPITDGANMSTAGDGQEAETPSGFDDQATQNEHSTPEDFERPTDDDQEQNQENNTSTAISNLKVAWSQANSAERFSFLQWLITHEKDEIQNRAVDAISALLEHANEDMR
jgi:hypothetical protein